jgi:hypothetical protein
MICQFDQDEAAKRAEAAAAAGGTTVFVTASATLKESVRRGFRKMQVHSASSVLNSRTVWRSCSVFGREGREQGM